MLIVSEVSVHPDVAGKTGVGSLSNESYEEEAVHLTVDREQRRGVYSSQGRYSLRDTPSTTWPSRAPTPIFHHLLIMLQ